MSPRRLIYLSGIVAVGFFAMASLTSAQTYLLPPGISPSSNVGTQLVPVAPPLNSADTIQRKAGSLLIGANNGTSYLCLNFGAATTPGPSLAPATDPAKCINSWDDVTASLGGPFLRYWPNRNFANQTVGTDPASYAPDDGLIRIQAQCVSGSCIDGSRQFYSFLTKAPAGLSGGYGLYATSGGSNTHYAGYFSGKMHVVGELCLNATTGVPCISEWTDVSSGGTLALELQSTNPPTPNTGSTSISANGIVGSIVIDSPASVISSTTTCGDGMCNAAETAGTCALDCATVVSFSSVAINPNSGKQRCALDQNRGCSVPSTCTVGGVNYGPCTNYTGNFSMTIPAQTGFPANTPAHVVITRAKSTTPSFVPLQGSRYTTGQVFGDSTIAFTGTVAPGVAVNLGHDRVTSSGDYIYRAFLGNPYPRFSAAYTPTTNATITYRKLTLLKPHPNAGIPGSESPDTQINCGGISSSFCEGYYSNGTTVTLVDEVATAGYTFTGWLGCDSTPNPTTCVVTMNADRQVTATYSVTGGDPGDDPPIEREPT